MAPFQNLEYRGVAVAKHYIAAASSMAVMQRHNTSTYLCTKLALKAKSLKITRQKGSVNDEESSTINFYTNFTRMAEI